LKALLVAIALTHPTSAQAQFRLEIAPALGAYMPTGQLPLGALTLTDVCTEHPEDPLCPTTSPRRRANRAVAIGGRWTAWFGKGGAIEGSFWYSPSGSTVNAFEDPGTAVVGSLRGVLSLAPQARTMSVLLMGGPAVIHRSGFPNDLTSFGGTVGLGLDIHPGRGLGFRAEIEDYLYSTQSTAGNGLFHQDFVLSLSMSPFGQRGERGR